MTGKDGGGPMETSVEQNTIANLAQAVRHHRIAREWSIDQLVRRSGVSKGAIVAVENATTNPSLGTIVRLADALGVSITDLLEDAREAEVRVISPTAHRRLWQGPHGGEAWLIETVSGPAPVELWRWLLPVGERYQGIPHPEGFRETLIVQQGTLELTLGDDSCLVPAGSTAIFAPDRPHIYAAPDETTEFLMLVHLLPPPTPSQSPS